jgi:hypothetical protein
MLKMILTFVGVFFLVVVVGVVGFALWGIVGVPGAVAFLVVCMALWLASGLAGQVGRNTSRPVSRKAPRNEARSGVSEQQHERREPRLFREGSPITVVVPRPKIITTHRRTIDVTDEWTEDRGH